ncbi:hypothetical protein HPB52_010967 [Rhipicephalus sanguineus]|uniref:CCHC-type domain-containing protein n=1 Tax=Rhipicephalus sanguineus TaxID=34632 RepID=A0A9D4PE94_RHISA|nr:hypothetical protein HPB52_010967 [Rhipicephalus sanguineus]
MEVQVNGEDISPEEFLEGAGWCTIGSKTQANRANAQSNNQTGAHSRTGEGADGNRQRSRQQQRNVRQQVIRNSKMPLLPRSDFKIVVRPRGGLDVATTGTVRRASAIYRAANAPAHEAGEDTVCSNNHQNIIVVSTPHATHAAKYRQLQAITVGYRRHEVSAYETAPDYTVKGIIKGIPLEEDAKSIHTNIVHARNPQALAAKRLSNTTTVIVAFEGPRVPTYVMYGGALLRCVLYRKQIDMCRCCGRLGHRMDVCPNPQDKVCRGCDAPNPGPDHQCSPRCKLCGGTHMTADRNCRARYKTPYVVTKRQWGRRRAAEEAEAAATTGPAGKPRSRSRTRSQSRSRSRSRTPGPQQHQKRRARSRTPRGTPTGDTKTAESVSFADAVKGKRAPNAEAGGKTPTKIETEIAQLTQAMQAMKRQIEHMQAQIRAKDELIQQLQSAANSETDPQAMQETQEEPTEDDEVEGPDTKRRPAPTPLKAARLKRTRAAIRDARLEALEGRLSSLE